VLAEHGQMLPIDPPLGDAATIGGLIATALAGPRRLSAGTLRDLLIGISAAHPSGTVTKAGGMVVKNVSGFDLPRLYHGALGTLGVIVSANFKVLPVPRAETTVVRTMPSLVEGLAATRRIRESRLMPDALEAAFFDGSWIAAVRLTGREGSLPPVVDEARALLGGEVETIDGRDSATWWRQYVDDQAISVNARQVLLRLTVRPRQTGSLAETLVRTFEIKGLTLLGLAASIGMGAVVARVEFPEHGNTAGDVMDLQQQLFALADHVTILAAPPAWKQGIDVWGRPPDALDVMRALKEQFDPARVLNPGRFAGFI
jgi:glycolate oxidase FAD binding subunit